VRPGFELRGGEISVAAALCRRLDGLPLAIELAASRLRGLSIGEVASRLTERLDDAGSSRAIQARHRTMRAAIEWSHDVLPPHECATLRRLSVFAGDFRPEAAAAVAGNWGPVDEGTDVREVCARLADKSMLVPKPNEHGTRYRMLETVRQFAAERLVATGEEVEARERHAAWFHQAVPDHRQWAGPQQSELMDSLRPDVDNLRGALGWYLGDGWDPQRALEMAGPMWWFWYMDGLIGEGRVWLRRVLAATTEQPNASRGLALRGAAALARIMQDLPEAMQFGEESLAVCRALHDERGIAAALNNLCISAMWSGDLEAARRYGEESLKAVVPLGDSQGLANSRNNLGLVARNAGELDRASELFAAARDGYRSGSNGRGLAAALTNLAIISRRRGDAEGGTALAIDALRLYSELRFEEGEIDCLEVLAALAVLTGDGLQALRLLTVSGRLRGELGSPLPPGDELEQRIDAERDARLLLGDAEADRVGRESAQTSLHDVVTEILEPRLAS
jgi:tetratricopeptide (TPR) repeat protein